MWNWESKLRSHANIWNIHLRSFQEAFRPSLYASLGMTLWPWPFKVTRSCQKFQPPVLHHVKNKIKKAAQKQCDAKLLLHHIVFMPVFVWREVLSPQASLFCLLHSFYRECLLPDIKKGGCDDMASYTVGMHSLLLV